MKSMTSKSSQWKYFIPWWLGWTIIWVFVWHRTGLNWEQSIYPALILHFLLALTNYITGQIANFINIGKKNILFQLTGNLLISFLILTSFIQLSLETQVLFALPKIEFAPWIPFIWVYSLLMLMTISLWTIFSGLLKNQEEISHRQLLTEELAKEAELANLRQQLQPHFLFNSLNSIYSLIGNQPQTAREMILKLSDFLRGTLKKDENQLVEFQEELNQVKRYLEIEKHRFGNRLDVRLKCADETLSLLIPPLLLQPAVENAVKFGIYDTIAQTQIEISAVKDGPYLIIRIINSFDSETTNPKAGTGFGLKSIQRRLFLLFSRSDLLDIQVNENTFQTILTIPQQL